MIDKNNSNFIRKNVLNLFLCKKESEKEVLTKFSEKKVSAIDKLQRSRIQ